MRNKLMIWTAALLCSAPLAHAQQPATDRGAVGHRRRRSPVRLDGRRRSTLRTVPGPARRRSSRESAFAKNTDTKIYDLGATNIGYRDQNYFVELHRREVEDLRVLRCDPAQLQLPDVHTLGADLHRRVQAGRQRAGRRAEQGARRRRRAAERHRNSRPDRSTSGSRSRSTSSRVGTRSTAGTRAT